MQCQSVSCICSFKKTPGPKIHCILSLFQSTLCWSWCLRKDETHVSNTKFALHLFVYYFNTNFCTQRHPQQFTPFVSVITHKTNKMLKDFDIKWMAFPAPHSPTKVYDFLSIGCGLDESFFGSSELQQSNNFLSINAGWFKMKCFMMGSS